MVVEADSPCHATLHDRNLQYTHPASRRTSLFVTIQTQISTGRMVTLDKILIFYTVYAGKRCDSALKIRHVPFLPFPSRTLLQRSRSSASGHIQAKWINNILLYFTLLYFILFYSPPSNKLNDIKGMRTFFTCA